MARYHSEVAFDHQHGFAVLGALENKDTLRKSIMAMDNPRKHR
jgi:hypothetical protein